MEVEVKTQAEMEAAIAAGQLPVLIGDGWFDLTNVIKVAVRGNPHVVARGSSQPHVEAWGSSQPHVEALGSSQPHVEALGSSQPHVVARESSQPRVEAWGSSQPHVEALGSSRPHVVARDSSQPHVEALGSSQPRVVARDSSQPHVVAWGYAMLSVEGAVRVDAGPLVQIIRRGRTATINGGQVRHIDLSTPELWCAYYGLEVRDGVVTLYKAVGSDFCSHRKGDYTPGTTPRATDWDGGAKECGGGLHFSPCPAMAMAFDPTATKFVACPVALREMVVHPEGMYPDKVKAAGCCGPVVECDRQGNPIGKQ